MSLGLFNNSPKGWVKFYETIDTRNESNSNNVQLKRYPTFN